MNSPYQDQNNEKDGDDKCAKKCSFNVVTAVFILKQGQ